MRWSGRGVFILAWVVLGLATATASALEAALPGRVRVRVATGEKAVRIQFQGEAQVALKEGNARLPEGVYTVRLEKARAARQRFHLVTKTFQMTEADEARAYVKEWKERGFDPQALIFGRKYETKDGATLDNRAYWISMHRTATEAEAKVAKKRLEGMGAWAWIQQETTEPGVGTVTVTNSAGKGVKGSIPLQIKSDHPISLKGINVGYMKETREDRAYGGTLEFRVAPDANLDVVEDAGLEEYIAGVLPGEMPAGWPIEALKAQAVAARSDVLAAAGGKHMLEGFDFCSTEHCRVYLGKAGRHESTDNAVRATLGQVLTAQNKVVPAVFSSNCGGWTENNDTVWSAPASTALRGAPDTKKGRESVERLGVSTWIKSPPTAFCETGDDNFRWRKRYTVKELSATVNRTCAVGDIRSIELGDRGTSGRLKSVKIVGSKGTETVRKDLAIRQAFGGLNSSAFIVEVEGNASHPTAFCFVGAGRGHGVGLCQEGTRGRAVSGQDYRAILNAYFDNSPLATVR